MTDPTQMHWAANWGSKTGCGLLILHANKILIVSRDALRPATLDHLTCTRCRVAAERLMYSVAPL